MNLLGMPIDDACKIMRELGIKYNLIQYSVPTKYYNADSARVVRVKKIEENYYQLVYCLFKTEPEGTPKANKPWVNY